MTFTYSAALAATQALHWLRWKIGATKSEAAPLVDDGEIAAALAAYGLTTTTAPTSATRPALCKAGASLCRGLAAALGRQATIALTPVGPVKNAAADTFLRIAAQLDAEGQASRADEQEPVELIDSLDYQVTRDGRDVSEYVGDRVL